MHLNKVMLLTSVLCMMMFILNSEAFPENSTQLPFNATQAKYQMYNTVVSSYIPMFALIFFGMLSLLLEYKLVCSGKWDPTEATRFMGLTTIVILTVFVVIISKSIESTLMTAIIGFLGTIAGYLAGSSKQNVLINPGNPPVGPVKPP